MLSELAFSRAEILAFFSASSDYKPEQDLHTSNKPALNFYNTPKYIFCVRKRKVAKGSLGALMSGKKIKLLSIARIDE
jgi:hypothetical protein